MKPLFGPTTGTRAFAYKTEAEALYFASSVRGVSHFERIETQGHAGFSMSAPEGYVFTATIEPCSVDGFPFSVVVGLEVDPDGGASPMKVELGSEARVAIGDETARGMLAAPSKSREA